MTIQDRAPVVLGAASPESDSAVAALEDAVRREGLAWIGGGTLDLAKRIGALGGTDGASRSVVAVCGMGSDAEAALWAAADHGEIGAVVLVEPLLGPGALELIGEWQEVPLMAVADPSHRPQLDAAVSAYLASRHPGSDVSVESFKPSTAALVARWLKDHLDSAATVTETTVTTSDGWELHGTLWLPDRDAPVPGVVLLHSGRSDRSVFSRLERLLAERGMAVLNLDWRGRGQSTSRGTLFTLSDEDRAEVWRDGEAALAGLAARPEVDGDRLAILGVVQGAEIAVRAAVRDRRVRAVVILTGYRPAEETEEAFLTGGGAEVLYVASADHGATTAAMRSLYQRSQGNRTRYVEYPGTALGYQLFEVDPGLEPAIVSWLAEILLP